MNSFRVQSLFILWISDRTTVAPMNKFKISPEFERGTWHDRCRAKTQLNWLVGRWMNQLNPLTKRTQRVEESKKGKKTSSIHKRFQVLGAPSSSSTSGAPITGAHFFFFFGRVEPSYSTAPFGHFYLNESLSWETHVMSVWKSPVKCRLFVVKKKKSLAQSETDVHLRTRNH